MITIRSERISPEEYIDFLKRTDLGSQYPEERFSERIPKLLKNASISRYISVICSTLDTLTAVLLFLPVFGNGTDAPAAVSLFSLTGIQSWLKIIFILIIGLIILNGICGAILSRFDQPVWNRHRLITGMALSVIGVGIFISTRQPYAGIVCFAILAIKAYLVFKGKTGFIRENKKVENPNGM